MRTPEQKAATKRWRKAHPERVNFYYMQRNQRLKQRAFEKLGGCCGRCGITDIRCLQIDHINGGGVKELRTIQSAGIRRKIVQGKTGYQLLCANCNWVKRYEQNECGNVTKWFLPSKVKEN